MSLPCPHRATKYEDVTRRQYSWSMRCDNLLGLQWSIFMAGRIKQLIDELVRLRTKGNPRVEHFVRAHLVLSGLDPDAYNPASADDPEKIRALENMIRDFQRR
jgi:hypothetical protein